MDSRDGGWMTVGETQNDLRILAELGQCLYILLHELFCLLNAERRALDHLIWCPSFVWDVQVAPNALRYASIVRRYNLYRVGPCRMRFSEASGCMQSAEANSGKVGWHLTVNLVYSSRAGQGDRVRYDPDFSFARCSAYGRADWL